MKALRHEKERQKELSKRLLQSHLDNFEMFYKFEEFCSIFDDDLWGANHKAYFYLELIGRFLATDQQDFIYRIGRQSSSAVIKESIMLSY